jgi:peptidoglycan-associated lipoprotein
VTHTTRFAASAAAVVLAAGLAASGCARRTQTATSPTAIPGPRPVAAASPAPRPAPGAPVTSAPIPSSPVAPGAGPAPVAAPPAAESPAPGTPSYSTAYPPGSSFTAPVDRRSRLDAIYFDFDQAELKPEYRRVLETNAEWLRRNPAVRIQIEGHCDERGSVQYNLALGERRAESAKRYLESLGVDGNRMQTISYGEERPAAPGSGEEAWARNRRAEFVVTTQ